MEFEDEKEDPEIVNTEEQSIEVTMQQEEQKSLVVPEQISIEISKDSSKIRESFLTNFSKGKDISAHDIYTDQSLAKSNDDHIVTVHKSLGKKTDSSDLSSRMKRASSQNFNTHSSKKINIPIDSQS